VEHDAESKREACLQLSTRGDGDSRRDDAEPEDGDGAGSIHFPVYFQN
jgi:hypothetical protein